MNIRFAPNTLYYGDCLDIMAGFPDSYIDLICLDPPFNSNEKYNKVFKDSGLRIDPQIKAFDDVWIWDGTSAERVGRRIGIPPAEEGRYSLMCHTLLRLKAKGYVARWMEDPRRWQITDAGASFLDTDF